MIQKFDFQKLDLQGAYLITPFYATDERLSLIHISEPTRH